MKTGLDLARSHGEIPDVVVDIFASQRDTLAKCEITGGVMTPRGDKIKSRFQSTSFGKSEIVLDDYDDIYFVAGVSPYDMTSFSEPNAIPPISRAVVRDTVRGWAGDWAYKMADALATASAAAKVHFVGEPFQSDASSFAREMTSSLMPNENEMISRIATIKQMIADSLAQLRPRLATIFHPPLICLERFGMFTRDEYCRGSVRLMQPEREHPLRDIRHMNALYGLRLVRALLSGENTELVPLAPVLPS